MAQHVRAGRPEWVSMLAVAAAMLALQWPLMTNPGWFSHDELQWAARAQGTMGAPLPWVSWLDIGAFQYRPLTFNAWLWLSRQWFDAPPLLHACFLALGLANALLLQRVLRAAGAAPRVAAAGAFVFAAGPQAAYVHGWVGTLGDLLWVGLALAIALAALRARGTTALAVVAVASMVLALLAKEAALSIPALALVACLLDRNRLAWRVVVVATAVPALAYLALRLQVIAVGGERAGLYDWSIAHVPRRWLEHQLFAPMPSVFEIGATLARGLGEARPLVATALWCALVAALGRAGWRWAVAFVAGGIAALGPVLVLSASYNQYGYGFAALCAAVVALAWPRLPRWGHATATLLALLLTWHGVNVVRTMRDVGEVQAVFSPALAEIARDVGRVRLAVEDEDTRWIFERLTHGVPAYRGVALGDRVRLVGHGEATHVVSADGRIRPAAAGDRERNPR